MIKLENFIQLDKSRRLYSLSSSEGINYNDGDLAEAIAPASVLE